MFVNKKINNKFDNLSFSPDDEVKCEIYLQYEEQNKISDETYNN